MSTESQTILNFGVALQKSAMVAVDLTFLLTLSVMWSPDLLHCRPKGQIEII